MNENGKGKGNGTLEAIKNLNWPTVVLILFTGGTNWLATKDNGTQIQYQREQVVREVHDMHSQIEEFEKRQKDMLQILQDLQSRKVP
jgi:hypothetical protein